MADFATVDDLVKDWRALSAEEQTSAAAKIAVASAIMRKRVPAIDQRITDAVVDPELAKYVCLEMVKRAMRNPEGYTYQAVGPFTAGRDVKGMASGNMDLTPGEMSLLSPPRGGIGVESIQVSADLTPYQPEDCDDALFW